MSDQTSLPTRALFALAGHSVTGLRLGQIADAVGESAPTTLRAIHRMRDDGLVEAVPNLDKHWRLAPRIVQIALQHQAELAREEARLTEFKQRYSRLPG
jgi:DNA-binding IclR family transcriptional regulator